MGSQTHTISQNQQAFIQHQKLFFVGTAMADGRVNISPKGMDSLKVINPNRVIWLNVTGSGNETATHIKNLNRMTIMFCAFEGQPLILRIYGKARVIHNYDPEWSELVAMFKPLPGARQIFDLDVELVQNSCGMAVPFFDYQDEREQLNQWAQKQGQEGIAQYWQRKNSLSLDGHETDILKEK